MTKTDGASKILMYAHPFFQGKEWYDWVYVHFEEFNASGDAIENYYPARILGFVTINNVPEAVVHCSEKPINWTDMDDNFIVRTKLGSSAEPHETIFPPGTEVVALSCVSNTKSNSLTVVIISSIAKSNSLTTSSINDSNSRIRGGIIAKSNSLTASSIDESNSRIRGGIHGGCEWGSVRCSTGIVGAKRRQRCGRCHAQDWPAC